MARQLLESSRSEMTGRGWSQGEIVATVNSPLRTLRPSQAPTSERGVPHILHASLLQQSRSQCICSATMYPFLRNEQASVPSPSPSPLKRPWPFGEDGDHRSSASTPQSSQVSETSDSSAIDNICFGSVNPVISGRWFHN